MAKRKPGALDDEFPPLREFNNIDENGQTCKSAIVLFSTAHLHIRIDNGAGHCRLFASAHGGQHDVQVSSCGKSPNKPARRRPLADCTNALWNDPKRGRVGEELAAKRKREAERKRQYRARKKAELENSLPMSVRESSMTNVAGVNVVSARCTIEEAASRNHLNATPINVHTGIFGEGNHGTCQTSQLSGLTGNIREARLVNSTKRPLHDITNIEDSGGNKNKVVECHGNKEVKKKKKGMVGSAGLAHKSSFEPSLFDQTPFSAILELEHTGSPRKRIINRSANNLETSDNIDGHPRIGATIDVCASNIDGDEDESWLHRNDNWHPSTVILRRHGGNLDGGVGQSVTPEELQKAKRREYNKEYRQRKKEELAIAHQTQNGAKIPADIDADKLLQVHATKLAKHREAVKRYRLRNSSMTKIGIHPQVGPSLPTGDHTHDNRPVHDSGIWDPDASERPGFDEENLETREPIDDDIDDPLADDEGRVFFRPDMRYKSYRVNGQDGGAEGRPDPYDYVYDNLPKKHHVLGHAPDCEHCGAKRFPGEGAAFCCRDKWFIFIFPRCLQS